MAQMVATHVSSSWCGLDLAILGVRHQVHLESCHFLRRSLPQVSTLLLETAEGATYALKAHLLGRGGRFHRRRDSQVANLRRLSPYATRTSLARSGYALMSTQWWLIPRARAERSTPSRLVARVQFCQQTGVLRRAGARFKTGAIVDTWPERERFVIGASKEPPSRI